MADFSKIRNQLSRKQSGQAIAEGAAIIPVLIFFTILLGFLVVNTSIVGTYNYRLNAIASEGARQLNAGRWWLGMERFEPGKFNLKDAEQDVRELVEAEVKEMGWKNAKVSNIEFEHKTATARGQRLNIVRVSFDVSGLQVYSGGIFPSAIKLHASGISSDSEFAVSRHSLAVIHTINPATGVQRAIRVPIYNATIGNNTPAHPTWKWLQAGPSIGTSPVVTLNIYSETTGQLSLSHTDVNKKTSTIDTANWGETFQ